MYYMQQKIEINQDSEQEVNDVLHFFSLSLILSNPPFYNNYKITTHILSIFAYLLSLFMKTTNINCIYTVISKLFDSSIYL